MNRKEIGTTSILLPEEEPELYLVPRPLLRKSSMLEVLFSCVLFVACLPSFSCS